MGLFKSGKAKADDLLSILIPSLEWEIKEEIKKRLLAQMDDVAQTAASKVVAYGYDEAIKALTIQVRAPKREWVGLTDDELAEFSDMKLGAYDLCLEVEAKLKEKNGGN
jgi:hypothetical protein